MGALFSPEAFMTATRQFIAQTNGWSLENLYLSVNIGESAISNESFVLTGLTLEASKWDTQSNKLALTPLMVTPLPPTSFTWKLKGTNTGKTGKEISIPVYLDETRKDLLFSVELAVPDNIPEVIWYQKAVAITCWSALISHRPQF